MKHLAIAAVLLTACAAPKPQAAPTTGPPATKPAAMGVVRHDFTPGATTSILVPATAAPPVTTALPEVVPLAETEPVPAAVGECGGWEGVVAAHFPASEVGNACSVLLCESQGNPNAVSPTDDHGLFQINVVHRNSFDWSRRYDPHVNTSFAASLWRQKGWQPWTCQP